MGLLPFRERALFYLEYTTKEVPSRVEDPADLVRGWEGMQSRSVAQRHLPFYGTPSSTKIILRCGAIVKISMKAERDALHKSGNTAEGGPLARCVA
jgi:hypothetical protein